MQTSLNPQRVRFSETPWLLFALFFLVFALGIASGFVVRAVSAPSAYTQRVSVVRVTEPCPAGSHVVVWYSAQTWSCVSNAPQN
jgi:hypothetical protein